MKYVVGLGNPGIKYKLNRHNLGFLFLDYLAAENKFEFTFHKKFNAQMHYDGQAGVIYAKPHTYMNASGDALSKIVNYYEPKNKDFERHNLLVIHDELDLQAGEYKLQYGRGAAGHNGVKSIIEHLGSNQFWRCRIGIGNKNIPTPVESFVLEDFSSLEIEQLVTLFKTIQTSIAKSFST